MAEEYNYDEYNRLCGEQARLEEESYYYEQRISELESNLEQLKSARDIVADVKENIKDIKKEIKKFPDKELSEWQGYNFNELKDSSEEGYFKNYYEFYIDNIDDIQDSLNDEITSVQNEIWEKDGIWGDIKSALNSVWNEIRNFFN